MRQILYSEILKERCNAKALGAYSASVNASTVSKEDIPIWAYDEYSQWHQGLAKSYTKSELEKMLYKEQGKSDKYAQSHLKSISKTSSMQSNSQRRAQGRNNLESNYNHIRAYTNALEIHKFYPDKAKK